MPLIFMPRKSAMICLLILGTICLVDGINKKDVKETLVGLASLTYAIFTLVADRRKKLADKELAAQQKSPPVQKPR